MKKIITLLIGLIFILSITTGLASENSSSSISAELESHGYKVYEADDLLVLLYEAGTDIALNSIQTPSLDDLFISKDEAEAYISQFNRILFLILRNDKVYIGGELKPPFFDTESNGLLSVDALQEMFSPSGITTQP